MKKFNITLFVALLTCSAVQAASDEIVVDCNHAERPAVRVVIVKSSDGEIYALETVGAGDPSQIFLQEGGESPLSEDGNRYRWIGEGFGLDYQNLPASVKAFGGILTDRDLSPGPIRLNCFR